MSGFSDLSPFGQLKNLKSLHLENLRRVTTFEGLKGIKSLRYLHIDGTLDWDQPIQDFKFLEGLVNLEVFSLRFVKITTDYPALLSILNLKNLKKIKIGRATLKSEEYAFLQTAFPNLEGTDWELCWDYQGWYEFLGKRAGRVKKGTPNTDKRCAEFVENYNMMKESAAELINKSC